jgi:factor associated with neutral sphingomyelinase activation
MQSSSPSRFSPLLLDFGEYYFTDFSAHCFIHPGIFGSETLSDASAVPLGQRRLIKGWLRICSNSIVFDAEDRDLPILRIKFEKTSSIELLCSGKNVLSDELAESLCDVGKTLVRKESDELRKSNPSLFQLYSEMNVVSKLAKALEVLDSFGIVEAFVVKTAQVIFCRENNKYSPYRFVNCSEHSGLFLFSLPFTKVTKPFGLLNALHQVKTLKNSKISNDTLKQLILEHEQSTSFNTSWLVDHRERTQLRSAVLCSRISALLKTPGWLQITNTRFYFQQINNHDMDPVKHVPLSSITKIYKRSYTLRDVGIEIYFSSKFADLNIEPTFFLTFETVDMRDKILHVFLELIGSEKLGGVDSEKYEMQLKWAAKEISNYEYLLFLNQHAGRSFNDLTQYPVFPWIIQDYKSSELNLNNPSTFRDLSKPIGALNPDRLRDFKTRMRELEFIDPTRKFLYGTHYSTPAYVLFFLVRIYPEYMLCLQNGKFDDADRLFNSISETWNSCLSNAADVKELIPQFYGFNDSNFKSDDFLKNQKDLLLGKRQNKKEVGDVELPPWASSPEDFLKKCKDALESDYVSDRLHQWIDLIFGYKNCGDEALKNDNLFYYLTYEGAVEIDKITDPAEKLSIELQINEFGQTPKQLFAAPHPSRMPASVQALGDAEFNVAAFDFDSFKRNFELLSDPFTLELHKNELSAVSYVSELDEIFSTGTDGFLKVYSLKANKVKRNSSISKLSLSCMHVLSSSIASSAASAFVGSWDNSIYLYSSLMGNSSVTFHAHEDAVSSLQVSEQTSTMVSGSWDSSVKIWDVSDGSDFRRNCKAVFNDHDSAVKSVAIGNLGNIFASGTENGNIMLWDWRQKVLIRELEGRHSEEITCLRFSPDNSMLASSSLSDGIINIWNVLSGEVIVKLSQNSSPKQIEFFGNDHIAILDESNEALSLWNIKSASLLHEKSTHQPKSSCFYLDKLSQILITGGMQSFTFQRPSVA